ncbi:MAG: ABC transporter permease [Bacteroidaceae bacterium]|nr:ABC transporter permease [Bacteroidaceae bacterium]
MMKKILAQSYLYLLLLALYAPIAIIIIFSFTSSKSIGDWRGFSLELYSNMFSGHAAHSATIMTALINTVVIAVMAAALSTILGSIAAVGIFNIRNRKLRQAIQFTNNIPMINPDIITGISLFLLFISLGISGGYLTVILAHTVFCTPYVVLNVMPRLARMNPNIYEAALDLGATPLQAFRKVIIPEIRPGMFSGFILSFTLSIDDFAVTLFTKGSDGLETLSTYIYADARKGGLTPELRCLAAIIFLTVLILLLVFNYRSNRLAKEQQH